MNAQVTLRSGEDETVFDTPHPPRVGSTVTYKGRDWLVTAYEYQLKRRISIPFEIVTPRTS